MQGADELSVCNLQIAVLSDVLLLDGAHVCRQDADELSVCNMQIAVLSDVLEENGMDMDAILDAQLGGEGSDEEDALQQGTSEQGMEGTSHLAAEGPDVEGEPGGTHGFQLAGILLHSWS